MRREILDFEYFIIFIIALFILFTSCSIDEKSKEREILGYETRTVIIDQYNSYQYGSSGDLNSFTEQGWEIKTSRDADLYIQGMKFLDRIEYTLQRPIYDN